MLPSLPAYQPLAASRTCSVSTSKEMAGEGEWEGRTRSCGRGMSDSDDDKLLGAQKAEVGATDLGKRDERADHDEGEGTSSDTKKPHNRNRRQQARQGVPVGRWQPQLEDEQDREVASEYGG